jgi:hypothetical protein
MSEVVMDRIIAAVERMRSLPESRIDVGLGQGHETFLTYKRKSLYHPQFSPAPVVGDDDIAYFEEALLEIQTWLAPNQLPKDYLFFLNYYGGLVVGGEHYALIIAGIGPMTEVWYSYIAGDSRAYEGGLLKIAGFGFGEEEDEGDTVFYFLDLGGAVHQYCVIGLSKQELDREGVGFKDVLPNPHAHPTCWTKVADSFTEWLELAADTRATFGYIEAEEGFEGPLHLHVDSFSFQNPDREPHRDAYWPEPEVDGSVSHPIAPGLLEERGLLFVLGSGTLEPTIGLEVCQLGIQALIERYYEPHEPFPLDVRTRLQVSFQAADEAIRGYLQSSQGDSLGSNMMAAVVQNDRLTVANVGICGAYLVRGTVVDKLVPWPGPFRPFGHVHRLLLGYHTPLVLEIDRKKPPLDNPYLELISDVRVSDGDTLILTGDDTVWLLEEEVFDVIKSSPKEIAHRLAPMVSDSLTGQLNVTVTAIRFSETEHRA